MSKRLFVIHGWVGSPKEPLIAWLGEQGKEKGFETEVPEMPHPDVPTIDSWVKCLDEKVMYVDEETYFIGHSVGCQAILRYIQAQKGSKIGGAVFLAPWMHVSGLETQEEKDIARPWEEQPIDFAAIRQMSTKFTSVFSDNDPFVPLDANKEVFEKGLNSKIIIEHAKGHFTESDGVVNLPSAIEELMKL